VLIGLNKETAMPNTHAQEAAREVKYEKVGLTFGGHSVLYVDQAVHRGEKVVFDVTYRMENGKHFIVGEIAHFRKTREFGPVEISQEEADELWERDVRQAKRFWSRKPRLYIRFSARYKKNKPVEYVIDGPLTIISEKEAAPCPK